MYGGSSASAGMGQESNSVSSTAPGEAPPQPQNLITWLFAGAENRAIDPHATD
jgi:hypothetical protein